MAGQEKIQGGAAMADSERLEQRLIEILATKIDAEADQITLDQKLSELDMDSLDFVELIFDIEEEYDVEIPYNANESRLEEMSIKDFLVIAVPTLLEAGVAIDRE